MKWNNWARRLKEGKEEKRIDDIFIKIEESAFKYTLLYFLKSGKSSLKEPGVLIKRSHVKYIMPLTKRSMYNHLGTLSVVFRFDLFIM